MLKLVMQISSFSAVLLELCSFSGSLRLECGLAGLAFGYKLGLSCSSLLLVLLIAFHLFPETPLLFSARSFGTPRMYSST
jgi:hypothetical protein